MTRKLTAPLRSLAGLVDRRPRTVLVGLVAAVVVLGAAAATMFGLHTAERADAEARSAAQAAAARSVAELLTYDPATIGTDVNRYLGLVTGPFGDDYGRLLKDVVVPAAQRDKVTTKTEVTGSAVVGRDADTVTVLVFLNQASQSASVPAGTPSGSRVRVAMEDVDGTWKISGFTPV